MCFSNNFIERQAFEMSEKIRKHSLYKFVKVYYSGTQSLRFQQQYDHSNGYNGTAGDESALITKVILEDNDGTLYSVEPNPNGVRFAKREITYKEYLKLEKRETFNGLATFFVIIVFFSALMFTIMKYFA